MSKEILQIRDKLNINAINDQDFNTILHQAITFIIEHDEFQTNWSNHIKKYYSTIPATFNELNFAQSSMNKKLYFKAIEDTLFSISVFDSDKEEKFLNIFREIIQEFDIKDIRAMDDNDLELFSVLQIFLKHEDIETKTRFLEKNDFPDETYKELQYQINQAFQMKLFPVINVLLEKMLRNLFIDILSKNFRRNRDDMREFFVPECGEFQPFLVLLNNVENKIKQVKPISSSFYRVFLNKIKIYYINWKKTDYIAWNVAYQNDANMILSVLIRFYNSL